jgi:hypothetical protein
MVYNRFVGFICSKNRYAFDASHDSMVQFPGNFYAGFAVNTNHAPMAISDINLPRTFKLSSGRITKKDAVPYFSLFKP